MSEAICHAPRAISKQFLWCNMVCCPASVATATGENHCHKRGHLVLDGVWVGWCISSVIHMKARTQGLPAEHCILTK